MGAQRWLRVIGCGGLLGALLLGVPGLARAAEPAQPVSDVYGGAPGSTVTVAAPGVLANDVNLTPDMGVKLTTAPCRFTNEDTNPTGTCEPTGETVNLVRDGSFTLTQGQGTPNGRRRFGYCIVDATDECVHSGQQIVQVWFVDPVAAADHYEVTPDTRLFVESPGILANDTSVPLGAGVEIKSWPTHGSLYGDARNGTTIHGAFHYEPAAGFEGADSFSYCVLALAPQSGCDTDVVPVTIEVTDDPAALPATPPGFSQVQSLNAQPLDDFYATTVTRGIAVAPAGILANDDLGLSSGILLRSGPSHGTLQLTDDGGFTYRPSSRFYIGYDTFTYCLKAPIAPPGPKAASGRAAPVGPDDPGVCVSGDATVQLYFEPLVDAVDDAYATTKDTPLEVGSPGVLVNDDPAKRSPWQMFAFQVDPPTTGGFEFDGSLLTDGSFGYIPAPGFVGLDTFTYCVMVQLDGEVGCISDVATVSVTVTDAAVVPPVTPEDPHDPPVTPEDPQDPPVTPEDPEDPPLVPDDPEVPEVPDTPSTPVGPHSPSSAEQLPRTGSAAARQAAAALALIGIGLNLVAHSRRKPATTALR